MQKLLPTLVIASLCQSIVLYLAIAWPLMIEKAKRESAPTDDLIANVLMGGIPYVLLGLVVGTFSAFIVHGLLTTIKP